MKREFVSRTRKNVILVLILTLIIQTVGSIIAPQKSYAYSLGQTFTDTSRSPEVIIDLGAPGVDMEEYTIQVYLDYMLAKNYTSYETYYSEDGFIWYKDDEGKGDKDGGMSSLFWLHYGKTKDTVKRVRYYKVNTFNTSGFREIKLTLEEGPYADDYTPPTAPTLTISPSTYTSGNVTATISGGSDYDSGIKKYQYKLSGATTQDWTDGSSVVISADGQTRVTARAVDKNNNLGAETTGVAFIDKTAPNPPTITLSASSYVNSDITVTMTPGSDNGTIKSGVKGVQYMLSGATSTSGLMQSYKDPLKISAEGITTITARTIDNVGNLSGNVTVYAYIDKTAPNAPTMTLSNPAYSNGPKQVTIASGADSGGSGVQKSQYKIGSSGQWTDYSSPITVAQNTAVYGRTLDNAGNVSAEASVNTNIDVTAPSAPGINLDPAHDTNGNVTVSLTHGSDEMSGVKQSEYKIGAGSWQVYTTPFIVTEEGQTSVFARTIDKAGNISSISSAVAVIDRTAPSAPEIVVSTDQYTKDDVDFTISGSQDARNVHYEYKLNSGSFQDGDSGTVTDSGVTVITARAVDAAGNTSSEITKTVYLDKEAPGITMTPAVRNWSDEDIVVNIRYGDGGSGVDPNRRYYKVTNSPDEPSSWDVASGNSIDVTITEEGTWYIHAKVDDMVGNSQSSTSSPLRLQKQPEAPVLSVLSVNEKEATLTWTLPGGTTLTDGYQYTLRNITSGKSWTVSYPTDQVVDTTLSAGSTYEYELTVKNHVGTATSNIVSMLTLPAAPTNLRLMPVDRDASQLVTSFDAVESATAYRLKAYNMATQTEVYNQTVTDSVYQPVFNLEPGTMYDIAVSAINDTGEGAATHQSFLSLPDEPGGFNSVRIQETSVQLSWNDVSTATYYDLERDGYSVYQDVYTSFEDTGLQPGTEHDYRVSAVNTTGGGDYSRLSLITLPDKVTGFRVTDASTHDISLSWVPVRGASGYKINLNDKEDFWIDGDTQTTITDLPAGTPAKFVIQAYNASGFGVTEAVYGLTIPDKPANVSVTDIGERSALISWDPTFGATKYKITLDGKDYIVSEPQLRIGTLEGGTTYSFTVASGNMSGFGPSIASGFLTLPPQVRGITAEKPRDRSLTLAWDPAKSATGYVIRERAGELGSAQGTTFDVAGLTPGMNYQFTIAAINETGVGAPSTFVWRALPSDVEEGDAWIEDITVDGARAVWKEVYGADYYRVYLDGELLEETTDLKHSFSGLESSSEHAVMIQPVNSTGEGEAYLLSFVTLPDSDYTVASTSTTNSITITWEGVKLNDTLVIAVSGTGEEIYRGKGESSYTWESLHSGRTYHFDIWTENSDGVASEVKKISERTKSKNVSVIGNKDENNPNLVITLPELTEETPVADATDAANNGDSIPNFIDIDRTFSRDKIRALAAEGIIEGTSENTFEPYREVTRAEFASLIVRALGLPEEPTTELTFTDISNDGWYIDELQTAIHYVVARGFSKEIFAPDVLISREQASKMIGNAVNDIPAETIEGFYSDEDGIAEWAKTEVLGLTQESLLQGYPDGSFRPKQNVTRAEAAEMIYNMYQDIKSEK